ncbi:hypothetical protein C2845_PM13G12490 [Panicum miliaceum]|uniref:Uncharacterized protein n=1 Tax=Panicum miliaceum TaxID=4540 RepID=A0A3L6RLG9_PANMI|nr:hypothetical protein C2845_PM13G12490 [Panicum miliaceum]
MMMRWYVGSRPIGLYRWVELHELGGRAVFLSRGSSRCYEATVTVPEGVYFDDRNYMRNGVDVCEAGYPCNDNGVWSMATGQITWWNLHLSGLCINVNIKNKKSAVLLRVIIR